MDLRGIDDRLDATLPKQSEIERLRKEADGWKAASKREGIYGFTLGAIIFLLIGIIVGHSM